ncbi:MAG TPA: hypothetical protein G4N90_03860 [Dehalococcoidia bacterium]|nr:hypothetical protein [Dehalococcoidia bacterium]
MYKKYPGLVTPNDNMTIWRYMDFTKFVSLLDKQALFFCRADKLGDPFEGSYPKINVSRRAEIFRDIMPPEDLSKVYKQTREFTAVNCWHMNRYESAAMWKLYLKSNEGIAIRSTFRRLRDSLQDKEHDTYIGKVQYIDYDKDKIPDDSISPFVYKRKSFEHEVELRAIIQVFIKGISLADNERPFEDGLYVPVALDLLINQIYLAPTSPRWLRELMESVTAKYGLKKKVYQSILDEKPIY